jgi:DNA-binding MltR family transcriptional regulator
MAKRNPIRTLESLMQQSPEFFESVDKEPDLARVLISTSFLDQVLATMLGQFFIDGETSSRLLSYTGLLGTFSARMDLAYCLALIPKDLYQNLRTVAEIRNRFAHHHLRLTFEDPEAAALCDKLVFLSMPDIPMSEDEYWLGTPESFPRTRNNRFVVIAAIMIVNLMQICETTKRRGPFEYVLPKRDLATPDSEMKE